MRFDPDWRVHPRETLLETLEERGLDRGDMPEELLDPVEGILHRDEPISPETAALLERHLGVTAQFWLNLEAEYRRPITAR